MKLRARTFMIGLAAVALVGCASDWKIHGGPKECIAMCTGWGLTFAGMVGVGDQSPTTNGATACVCQVPGAQPNPNAGGGPAAGASLAAPITAAQAAVAAQMAAQQMQQSQSSGAGRGPGR